MQYGGRKTAFAAIVTALLLVSALSAASAADVMFSVEPKKLSSAGPILLFASGLEPGQEVGVRTMMGGVMSDVSFLAKPSIQKADANGAVASIWNVRGRTVKRLMKNGTYSVELVDADGNTLASDTLEVAVKAKKK